MALAGAPAARADAPGGCPLGDDVDVIVFRDTAAGTGQYSTQWETVFWNDWAANHSATAPTHEFLDLEGFEACSAEDLGRAKAFFLPGGNAYDYTQSLRADGKAKIASFVAGGGLYVGTCAGFYYAATGYFWEYDTKWPDKGYWAYPDALGAFSADVEGSIVDIADEETAPGVFDGEAVTPLYRDGGNAANVSSGQNMVVYYGGPTLVSTPARTWIDRGKMSRRNSRRRRGLRSLNRGLRTSQLFERRRRGLKTGIVRGRYRARRRCTAGLAPHLGV